MKKAGSWIAFAALAASLIVIGLSHERNRQLVQELEIATQEKGRLESFPPPKSVRTQDGGASNRTEELESELMRLRGAATRAAQAEAEVSQLKRELIQARARGTGAADPSLQNPDALTAYLGSHVEAPANLNPLYTKEGLASAIQVAAQKAGISLRKISVDDSEFPFLTGVVTEPGDWPKLTEQLKAMEGYEFHGSVGDDTSHTLCTVPVRAYPAESMQNITRRMGGRLELFYHSFSAAPSGQQ
jgi:hypothetical protein